MNERSEDRSATKMSLDKVLEEIKERNITAVRFEQTDTNGVSRSKLIPARHFKEKAADGLNFFLGQLGSDVQSGIAKGSGFVEEFSFGDALMFPDYATFRVLPWLENTARILIEPTYRGEFVSAHPRVLARNQLEKLKGMGYSLLTAHEHEFYVIDRETGKPPNDDYNVRATVRMSPDPINRFINRLMAELPKVGVDVECAETEYGPGQLEMSYKPAFGIEAGDIAHTFKTSVKEIAIKEGLIASFMTKPYLEPEHSGSSCHINHSLWDVDGKTPVLYDANSPLGISEIGQHWLAGILAHARAIDVLVAPTVNCRKRVSAGQFCPINATWGVDNRSTLVRVKVNGDKGTYFEYRAGAAGCNPYIALAATIAAGMDGILNKHQLPPEVTGDACIPDDIPPKTPNLPRTMEDALAALLDDQVIKEALGEEFIKCFTAVKMHEARLEKAALDRGEKNWDFDFFFKYL